jgi:hypothetical protein
MSSMKDLRRGRRPVSRSGQLSRWLRAAIVLASISGAARSVAAQATNPGEPPPPPQTATPRPPAAAPAQPMRWWCEVNALPEPGAQLPPEEAALNFFISQVVARPRRVGPDELKAVERLCRTAFEVQFGGQWQLVTARAQQAATLDAANLGRQADMRLGNHQGHVRDFHIPG